MENIYINGNYLETTKTWHLEDSPWKAAQIIKMLTKHTLYPKSIGEIGCGAGGILHELSKNKSLEQVDFKGFDISPQAIELGKKIETPTLQFFLKNILEDDLNQFFDVLLVIDVFEHIPNYMDFLEKCRVKANYKIFHIPLDISVSSVLRNVVTKGRYTVGHLHYFTPESALSTLKDTGYEVVDYFFTNAAIDLFWVNPSVKKAVANIPRFLLSTFSKSLASRLLGGYSLMVLTK